MNDQLYDSQFARDMQRERFTQAALTGLLSGVDIIMLLHEGKKLPGKDIAQAAVILANHAIDALNQEFRSPIATEPSANDARKPASAPATAPGVPPDGGSVTPTLASSSTASEPEKAPAGNSENPQPWKRKPAPLS